MAESAGSIALLRGAFAGVARKSALNIRLTVLVCLVLIAGSFAAASALQMRLDRSHAIAQAAQFEAGRARDIAAVADAVLERFASAGRSFASGQLAVAPDGIRNIAIFDRRGVWQRVLRGSALDFPEFPVGWVAQAQYQRELSDSMMAFSYAGRIVVVLYDPTALVPKAMLEHAALLDPEGGTLEGTAISGDGFSAQGTHWPVIGETFLDTGSALSAWRGTLPLYLFVILGPAVAGACLAAIFAGEFEQAARATRAVKALKSIRPEERRLMVRLAEAERRAAEGVRSKSEFIAHMSHELRTPLNAVIGFAEIIERGFFGPTGHPKYVEYAHDIAQAGRSLHGKIGDILEYANVEAGRFPLRKEPVDLAALAIHCLSEHEGQAFARRISLEVGANSEARAWADPAAIRRILSILLANALQFAREGGRVRVDIRTEEGAAVLVLRDSGVGFSDREKERAGEAFARFDRAGRTTGAGLGLAIAMALARRMGGALKIGGYHGLGAVIELRLPLLAEPAGAPARQAG
ncbi:MAG: HAMP domain-containing histidine kinase [Alphaproteobacteria bacterium]|nr:HAMP domain-containing histidine kinase [Alphaproteobacteria bacterium]